MNSPEMTTTPREGTPIRCPACGLSVIAPGCATVAQILSVHRRRENVRLRCEASPADWRRVRAGSEAAPHDLDGRYTCAVLSECGVVWTRNPAGVLYAPAWAWRIWREAPTSEGRRRALAQLARDPVARQLFDAGSPDAQRRWLAALAASATESV